MNSFNIDEYLRTIGREELLTVEEEKMLLDLINKGDNKALDQLVKAKARFVVSLSAQYQNKGVSLQDLIVEGNKAMQHAALLYDLTSEEPFLKFAIPIARKALEELVKTSQHQ